MVKTAVFFAAFTRPVYARQTFEAIKKAQPQKLYFYSNHAREDNPDEVKNNSIIKDYVNEVDWDCEVHTWFRDVYVDQLTSIRTAIDWVFDNEESAIILEEDCVPTRAFFSFCDQMIDFYKDEKRIWYITGDNFFNLNPSGYDYIFSNYHWIWGWASWRDRWQAIDWDNFEVESMIAQGVHNHLFKTDQQRKERVKIYRKVAPIVRQTGCWDYALGVTCDQNTACAVVPSRQLVQNIGEVGEHQGNKKGGRTLFVHNPPMDADKEYIIRNRPRYIYPDWEFDYLQYKARRKWIPLWKRIVKDILNIVGM